MLNSDNMELVTDKTLGSWTRSKNDNATCDQDASKNDELFKFMTFTPDYLTQGSCVAGNTQNCTTFGPMNVGNEPRFGELTNLNTIQRELTNDKTMGVRTTPDIRTGKLIDPRLIQDMSTLESRYEHNTRLDTPASSSMNEHHLDEKARFASTHPVNFTRQETAVSSRVTRRNSFAQQCKTNRS